MFCQRWVLRGLHMSQTNVVSIYLGFADRHGGDDDDEDGDEDAPPARAVARAQLDDGSLPQLPRLPFLRAVVKLQTTMMMTTTGRVDQQKMPPRRRRV